jgi:hypothetical protein
MFPAIPFFLFLKTNSTCFTLSAIGFMVNFRVDNLNELIAALKEESIVT